VAHGSGVLPSDVSFYGAPGQEVKLLDGVMLIARSETLLANDVMFDERFEFHHYDMDFCRQAELKQLRMGTVTVSIVHESMGGYNDDWRRSCAKYLDKWKS
jgi:GT2 family glycosyltransferase